MRHHRVMRKRSLTLLEVIIAFTLLGFLLTALLPIYFQTKKQQILFEKGKEEILQRLRFYFRIKHLFENSATVKIEKDHLVFTYDNALDPDKSFRANVASTLKWNGKEIVLKTASKSGQSRPDEILWEKVTSPISFETAEQDSETLMISVNRILFRFKKSTL